MTVHSVIMLVNRDPRDVDKYQFNTVVAAAMKMVNTIQQLPELMKQEVDMKQASAATAVFCESIDFLLRLLAPIVPHITHVLWQAIGRGGQVLNAPWPQPDAKALQVDMLTLVVQVNGKLRSKIEVTTSSSQADIEALALADENVKKYIHDKQIAKIIVVPKRLINIVVKSS